MHEFNALQGHSGRAEGVKSQHGPNDPFNGAMILLRSSTRQRWPTGHWWPLRKAACSCGVNF
jgi:hypothetical protein